MATGKLVLRAAIQGADRRREDDVGAADTPFLMSG